MLEQDLKDEETLLETERLKILFKKNNYDKQQKKWFLESKIMNAKECGNKNLLILYERLLNEVLKS